MSRPRQDTTDQTAQAEWRANAAIQAWVEAAEHKCGRCWGPYGKSALRCVNEPGGK